jgi:hypothetical protein
MDLNDTEAIEQLAYNIQWHYALDIVEESDEAKTISEKTLSAFFKVVVASTPKITFIGCRSFFDNEFFSGGF